MKLIDTHAHLDQVDYIETSLERCVQDGICAVVAMSVDLQSMQKTLDISKRFLNPRIYPALGVHPGKSDPLLFKESMQFIRDHIQEAQAIGETGLDYWYKWVRGNMEERSKQYQYFEAQLDMAKEFDLPIVIHSRGAWRDCLSMTKAAGIKKALFHWYSGPVNKLEEIIEAGYFVSTSLSIGYSAESRTAMSAAPLDRILIETDSPVTYKEGDELFKSEPRHVALTLKYLALLKNIPIKQAGKVVHNNAISFFGLDMPYEK